MTGTYDMGFREYNPGLNRFLTRDMFNGALTDLGLGTDPWNANRYMFGGGNPISRVELNGHYAIDEIADRHSPVTPTITSPTTAGSTEDRSTQVPVGVDQRINESIGLPTGATQEQQAIQLSQMGVPPALAGINLAGAEADRSGLPDALQRVADVTGVTDTGDCAYSRALRACGMTALAIFRFGKIAAVVKHTDEAAKGGEDVARVGRWMSGR